MTKFNLSPDKFAAHLGFDNMEQLIQASEPIIYCGDATWYVTKLPNGGWAAWDDSELAADRVSFFGSRQDAINYHLEAYLSVE